MTSRLVSKIVMPMDAPDEWQIMIKGTPAGMISALTMPGGRQVADD